MPARSILDELNANFAAHRNAVLVIDKFKSRGQPLGAGRLVGGAPVVAESAPGSGFGPLGA